MSCIEGAVVIKNLFSINPGILKKSLKVCLVAEASLESVLVISAEISEAKTEWRLASHSPLLLSSLCGVFHGDISL